MKALKVLSTAALIGVSALALASCNNKNTEKTIIFHHAAGQTLQKEIDNAIARFKEKFPGWDVEQASQGGYDELKSATVSNLQAGTQPDIAYCYADHVATYITAGKVLDMSKFINSTDTVEASSGSLNVGYSSAEVADFVPGYYNEGLATNYADYDKYGFTATSMLTMPFSKSTELMYVNLDAMKAAGVSEIPTTWDELFAAAEKIKEKYPVSTPIAYDSEANWAIAMAKQNGWNYTSPTSPYYTFRNETRLANWMDSLAPYYERGIITTKTTYGGYTSDLFTQGVEAGGCVFCIGSSGGASYQATDNFNWGVAAIPGSVVDGKVNKSVISQGPSLVMFDTGNSEKSTMAWMFMKELLDPSFQSSFSQSSGYNPVRLSTYDNESYKAFLDDTTNIKAVAAKVASTMSNDFFTSPAFNGSSDARIQIGSALVSVIKGEKDGASALEAAYKACGGK